MKTCWMLSDFLDQSSARGARWGSRHRQLQDTHRSHNPPVSAMIAKTYCWALKLGSGCYNHSSALGGPFLSDAGWLSTQFESQPRQSQDDAPIPPWGSNCFCPRALLFSVPPMKIASLRCSHFTLTRYHTPIGGGRRTILPQIQSEDPSEGHSTTSRQTNGDTILGQ